MVTVKCIGEAILTFEISSYVYNTITVYMSMYICTYCVSMYILYSGLFLRGKCFTNAQWYHYSRGKIFTNAWLLLTLLHLLQQFHRENFHE